MAKLSDGDARKALNALEIAALTTAPGAGGVIHIDLAVAEQSIQKKAVVYDDEDAHYDTISAFIKSMRGSDPDAALYWLAKMIHAGEDPRFIARRIVIHAAEDVGLADPMALVLANAAFQAAEFIGWPEARIPLAEAAIYIATATKSNSTVMAIDAALKDVESGRTLPVPEHLRDASYRGAKRLGHGQGYQYAHDHPGHFVAQDYLGADKRYYEPTEQGVEKKIKERVEKWRAQFAKAEVRTSDQPEGMTFRRRAALPPATMQNTIREAKQALREQVRADVEANAPGGARPRFGAARAHCWRPRPLWKTAQSVLFFAPLPEELDVWPLLDRGAGRRQESRPAPLCGGDPKLRGLPDSRSQSWICRWGTLAFASHAAAALRFRQTGWI